MVHRSLDCTRARMHTHGWFTAYNYYYAILHVIASANSICGCKIKDTAIVNNYCSISSLTIALPFARTRHAYAPSNLTSIPTISATRISTKWPVGQSLRCNPAIICPIVNMQHIFSWTTNISIESWGNLNQKDDIMENGILLIQTTNDITINTRSPHTLFNSSKEVRIVL